MSAAAPSSSSEKNKRLKLDDGASSLIPRPNQGPESAGDVDLGPEIHDPVADDEAHEFVPADAEEEAQDADAEKEAQDSVADDDAEMEEEDEAEDSVADDDDSEMEEEDGGGDPEAMSESDTDEEYDEATRRERNLKYLRGFVPKEYHEMHDRYLQQLTKSQGFDVDVSGMPIWLQRAMIHPIDINDEFFKPRVELAAKCACNYFNRKQKERVLEFSKVIKANIESAWWTIYLITLEAVDTKDKTDGVNGTKKHYQALVFISESTRKMAVGRIRLKPFDEGATGAQDV